MSLLAHIVSQNLPPEPAATQSLAYILRTAPELAASLTDLLWPSVGFKLGHVESELSFGDARPDLTIFDSDGRHRVFVENKFWAGLTDAQPVQYLAALPDDLPSGLVFILPEQRIPSVWDELKRRSRDAYKFGAEASSESVTRLQMGTRTMCATSWRHVLRMLGRVSPSDDLRRDVLQLEGLARFGELDGFPPLHGEELTGVSIPRRMIDYCDLVDDIVFDLRARGVARTERLLPTHTWYDTGRYFKVLERFDFWLGVSLVPWENVGITPLWLSVTPHLGNHYYQLERSFDDVQEIKEQRKSRKNEAKYLPIRLRTGAERDGVIRDAADQVQRIVEKIEEIIGEEGEPVEAP